MDTQVQLLSQAVVYQTEAIKQLTESLKSVNSGLIKVVQELTRQAADIETLKRRVDSETGY